MARESSTTSARMVSPRDLRNRAWRPSQTRRNAQSLNCRPAVELLAGFSRRHGQLVGGLWVLLAPSVVLRAAWATPVMFWAISLLPLAASATLRQISLVVAVCSSTALAMVFWMSLIWLMILPIWRDGLDRALGVALDRLDLLADVLGGLGGLLGQFLDLVGDDGEALAGLAGAGRLDGGVSASRLVCWAMEVITLMTLPISALLSPSLATVALVVSATLTAAVATLAASLAFLAISLMLAVISSAPVATVWTFLLTCSAAAETTLAWVGGLLGVGGHLLADRRQLAGGRGEGSGRSGPISRRCCRAGRREPLGVPRPAGRWRRRPGPSPPG